MNFEGVVMIVVFLFFQIVLFFGGLMLIFWLIIVVLVVVVVGYVIGCFCVVINGQGDMCNFYLFLFYYGWNVVMKFMVFGFLLMIVWLIVQLMIIGVFVLGLLLDIVIVEGLLFDLVMFEVCCIVDGIFVVVEQGVMMIVIVGNLNVDFEEVIGQLKEVGVIIIFDVIQVVWQVVQDYCGMSVIGGVVMLVVVLIVVIVGVVWGVL